MNPGDADTERADAIRPSSTLEADGGSERAKPARLAGARAEPNVGLRIGERIDRYLLLRKLGAGGMGTVYEAQDDKLGRKVALKVLHGDLGIKHHQRMQREALALARLSHPNVVHLYEIGLFEDRTFIAMELVPGRTLDQWQRERPPWRQCLQVYIQAGKGLVAAHAVGLVHRDFKPSNCILGDDGRARVLDFGLARAVGDDEQEVVSLAAPVAAEVRTGDRLTETGTILGTLAYMPPEQLAGAMATESSDQFSFCVSLYEALYGTRPFAGSSFGELAVSLTRGEPQSAPKGTRVPAKVRQALLRGLAREPSERWPSMDALLQALSRLARRNRRSTVGLGLAALLGLGAGVVLPLRAWRTEQCSGAGAALEGVWDAERREAARVAIAGIDVPYGEDTLERVGQRLDAYASEWTQMHREACEATTVRGEQSTEVMDLRMACLERARIGLRVATEQLLAPDAEVLERAYVLVDGLPPLVRCTDVEALRAGAEPPLAEDVDAVVDAEEALAEARAMVELGKATEAEAAVATAARALQDVGYEPIRTELVLVQGVVAGLHDDHATAELLLREAMGRAAQRGQWDELQESAVELLLLVGRTRSLDAEGLRYAELARGLAQRGGDPRRIGYVHIALGSVHGAHGRYAEAQAEYQLAIDGLEAAFGPEDTDVAISRGNLATMLHRQGHSDEAAQELYAVVAAFERSLGELHPQVLAVRNNLAAIELARGHLDAAETELRAVVELRTTLLGPRSVGVATARDNLANVLRAQDRLAEAVQEHRAALEIRLAVFGPSHPAVATSHNNLGTALHAQGQLEQAEAELRAAVDIGTQLEGDAHPSTALARHNLGLVLSSLARHAEAVEQLERAYASRSVGSTPLDRARTGFELAKALVAAGDERPRAIALARQADASYGEAGSKYHEERQSVRAWLAEHDATQ